jgi:excisionase family DNA binding protein
MSVTDARDAYLSVSEVSHRLNISIRTVQRWGEAGKLEVIRTSLGRLHPVESVERLQREHASAGD